MNKVKLFISAILAGMCISFGGVAFLSVDNKIVGALLFSVGLFVICTFKLNLFTGKVCYVFDNNIKYVVDLILIWIGNFVGTFIIAEMVKCTRIYTLGEKALSICSLKLSDSYASLFILGIFCNIFIYIAVEGFKENVHEIGKYLSIFFGVVIFIVCGFEHCVADMFYFCISNEYSLDVIIRLLIITMGNIMGGVGIRNIIKWISMSNRIIYST